jgi:hypothetical protein
MVEDDYVNIVVRVEDDYVNIVVRVDHYMA